ncbi:MAG: hypothetical protein EOP47_22700 [Sphingobacteriaceae bacterium]|nr:MAG: hypothetical protein EOP47_22700 [Sphingobacteriaceae bacterium]
MMILIDEQLPTKLKYRFDNIAHEVYTVRDIDWLGKKNGELLNLMIGNRFDALITNDKNLYYQQKISNLNLALININTKTNRYDDVLDVLNLIINTLNKISSVGVVNATDNYYILNKS